MRIVYPYVTVFPEAVAALDGWTVEMVDVSSDDQAYYRLMADLWRSGDDFTVVEQDIVLAPGALQGLVECPQPWCGCPYWQWHSGWGVWHGAVRYRADLALKLPEIPDLIQWRHWGALDSAWINHLRLLGYPEAHWHWPAAKHLTKLPPVAMIYGCADCGAALRHEDLRESPQTPCRECGHLNQMVVPTVTPTTPVL
jgi:hypothetical protein